MALRASTSKGSRSHQVGRVHQSNPSATIDVELCATDDETKVFEEAADLVLKITLDLSLTMYPALAGHT